MFKRIFRKEFFITSFWKQNKWHRHGVFIHTVRLIYQCIINRKYSYIPAAILHDIGKPIIAHQTEKDKINKEYSFTNHEEISYRMICKYSFISNFTKYLVRYHYIHRAIDKSLRKGNFKKYARLEKKYKKINPILISHLQTFQELDDIAKGK